MVTLAVQASGIAIIATGMVLVIVSRNIDLSVGSLVGLIAMTYALLMTDWMPNILGIGAGLPVPLGHRPGPGHGARGARRRAPGLHHRLHRRALVHRHPRRPAVDPRRRLVPVQRRRRLRPRPELPAHRRRGAGLDRGHADLGPRLVGCVAIVALLVNGRRQRRRYGFPLRPMWAEVLHRRRGLRRGPRRVARSPTPTCGRRASPIGSRSSRTGVRRPPAAG